jgi:hypothetical protein
MMSKRLLTLTAALVVGAAQPVWASAVFDFSYQFATSADKVTGSVAGTFNDNGTPGNASDDYVEGVTVLSAFFDGVAMTGPLELSAYDQFAWAVGPAKMAFAASSNNFIMADCSDFATCSTVSADSSATYNYFMMRTPGQKGVSANFYSRPAGSSPATDVKEDPVNAAGWSLVERRDVTSVPEPGSYALCGLALGALALTRRSRRRQT